MSRRRASRGLNASSGWEDAALLARRAASAPTERCLNLTPPRAAGRSPGAQRRGVGCRRGWAARPATPDCGRQAAAPLRGRGQPDCCPPPASSPAGRSAQVTCVPTPRNVLGMSRRAYPSQLVYLLAFCSTPLLAPHEASDQNSPTSPCFEKVACACAGVNGSKSRSNLVAYQSRPRS
jgi:hypothetical protein